MQQQLPFRQPYYLHRPQSPKNQGVPMAAKNLSLTMSIGANQTATNFLPAPREQTLIHMASESSLQPMDRYERLELELRCLSKQNGQLKEENEQLRRELGRGRREAELRSSEKAGSLSPDLRGTIKKEMGEIRELRMKVDKLSKQCKLDEQMIEKMEERIKRLSVEVARKNAEAEEARADLSRLEQLKDKTASVMRLYSDLQSKFNGEQLDWMKWKQSWLAEKEFYLDRIRELERHNYH